MLTTTILLDFLCVFAAAISAQAVPLSPWRPTCTALPSGRYTISSVRNNWKLRPYHLAMSPPAIITEKTPPVGEYGVWEIASTPDDNYYMLNVGEGNLVSTLHRAEGISQPYTAYSSAPSTFSILCAGRGTYIIKNPDADEVWTASPGATVHMIAASGDNTQRFRFTKV